jgi:hypothetical protein
MSGIGSRRCKRFIGELLNVTAKCKDLGEYWHINVFTVAQPLEDNTKIERARGRERERQGGCEEQESSVRHFHIRQGTRKSVTLLRSCQASPIVLLLRAV